jgi:hypothetical protein
VASSVPSPHRRFFRGPGDVMTCPVPLAKKIVLQVAVRDIGQLTDI